MGIKALRKIQLGRETTAGTAVAATTLWRGLGTLEDQREIKFPVEDIGYLSGTDRSTTPKLLGGMSFDSVEATFEQIPHIFEAGIKTVGTGVTDTGGSGKVYTYPFPTTSANAIKTYTIEGGDDVAAEEMEYSFVTDFSIDGGGGESLMISSNWAGRQISTSTFTGAISVPSVEDIVFSRGALYIDAVSGTLGTTKVTQTFLKMTLNVRTGWRPEFSADGNPAPYFVFAKNTGPEITLDVTFEHNATAVTEIAAWRAQTPRLVRALFEGTALTTAGTFSNKSFIIDLAGKWEKFSKIGDQDGNDIVTGTLRARYNSTAAFFAQLKVVNELASIP